MVIKAYRCKKCEDVIFSRAKHDYRSCSCGAIAVNGGIEFFRVTSRNQFPETVALDLDITKEELYADWNSRKDEFGWIKSGKVLVPQATFDRKISNL